jgi:hypothetical protein
VSCAALRSTAAGRTAGATVIHRRMNDPKTAMRDYEAAREAAPEWLRERLVSDLDACAAAAERSRKTKPSVDAAPPFWISPAEDRSFVEPPTEKHEPGSIHLCGRSC